MRQILITGSASFISSHLEVYLVEINRYKITIFDNLEEQVHGKTGKPPSYLLKKASLMKITSLFQLKRLLIKIIILINFAYFLLSEILRFLNL